MLREGMFLADRYEIIEQIGTGGMADVYKAKCHKLNRYVAIKVMKSEFSQDKTFVSKFWAEAQSAAGLVNPNVVNVYDVGVENGIYYIVMELVEGITLKKYIEKRGRLPYKEAVSIAIQVANGMDAAHKHNIVHRDIKPQNIIISKEGKVKVTDFGIAKVASSATINTSASMGSVHYISPEQARGGYSDERSDIYSLGITLFEMLTGTVPFDGDSAVSVAVQHIQDSIPLPSQLVEGVPVSVDKIVLKCTQKKTDRRYQSAAELIVDLKKSLVMPDEDFVRMGSAYDSVLKKDEEEYNPDDDELLTESAGHDLDDDNDDTDDELLENDSDKDEDIDDERNDKLELVMKCIGIGIAVIILMITIFVVIKLVGNGKNTANNNKNSVEATTVNTANNNSSDMVEVPKVVGMTKEDAIKALNKLGLGYKAVTQSSDTVAEDCVISQGNVGGSKVEKNSQIVLTISTGKENKEVTVPNVKGKSEQEAKEAIEAANLVASVDYQYSDSVEAGNVIKYSPSGSVAEGSTVTIHVSRGKKVTNVSVPNVLGMSESLASQTLDSANLKVTVKYETSSKAEYGTVTSQTPYSAGDSVPSGTTITIYVSHYQQTAQQTTTAANNKNNNGNSNNSSN
ncbi:MAG TPA: Stk1 family PASTA domain-containing Ser/Thr kinase [Eubacterium sp.]|nr:Stk1 family PASTA domain-containing Ser/Thr kinase [Eubacterium sp.]HCH82810.1 Stk1 family PASTA domain-containing Ser/Thr kinase [Eubacterium sp.]